jgi:hypothetical protein
MFANIKTTDITTRLEEARPIADSTYRCLSGQQNVWTIGIVYNDHELYTIPKEYLAPIHHIA